MMTILTFLTAQSGADISTVPADFVKHFMIMAAFLAGMGGAWWWGKRGTKGQPMEIGQPVSVDASVTHAPVYAQRAEVDAIKTDIERRTRENLRQHEETARVIGELRQAGNDRMQTLLKALAEMETRMTRATLDELKDIHTRLNPVAEMSASHTATLKSLEGRISHLWEMIQQLWAQVFRKSAPRG